MNNFHSSLSLLLLLFLSFSFHREGYSKNKIDKPLSFFNFGTDSVNSSSIPSIKNGEYSPSATDFITNLPNDWSRWGKLAFTSKQIPLLCAIGVSTTGLVLIDHETYTPVARAFRQSKAFEDFSKVFVFVGDGRFQFGLAGAFGLYGWECS